MNYTVKFSSLRCYNCGKKNEEITLGMSILDSWYYEGINNELGEAKRALCPECFQKIKDDIFKRSLRKSAEEPDNAVQLTICLELDFVKRDPEPKQPDVSTSEHRYTYNPNEPEPESRFLDDCYYYIADGCCNARGDVTSCVDCEDSKFINKDEPYRRYENVCYYYSADGCCDLYGNMSSCEDCNDLRIINEDELDDLKHIDV